MTETEWLACTKATQPVMDWLRRRGSDRKFYLVSVAVLRLIWDQLPDEQYRELVSLIEKYADGQCSEIELGRSARCREQCNRSIRHTGRAGEEAGPQATGGSNGGSTRSLSEERLLIRLQCRRGRGRCREASDSVARRCVPSFAMSSGIHSGPYGSKPGLADQLPSRPLPNPSTPHVPLTACLSSPMPWKTPAVPTPTS